MRTLFLTCTLALVLLAAGCGDDDDTAVGAPADDPGQSDDPAAPTPSDPPVDDEPILGAGPYPIADLTITVTMDENTDPTVSRLACLGDTATITGDGEPAGAAAMCLALQELPIRERLIGGEPGDRACTEQYGGPQTATVTGTLDGEAIDTSFHRADGCGIGDWALLAPILPPTP